MARINATTTNHNISTKWSSSNENYRFVLKNTKNKEFIVCRRVGCLSWKKNDSYKRESGISRRNIFISSSICSRLSKLFLYLFDKKRQIVSLSKWHWYIHITNVYLDRDHTIVKYRILEIIILTYIAGQKRERIDKERKNKRKKRKRIIYPL